MDGWLFSPWTFEPSHTASSGLPVQTLRARNAMAAASRIGLSRPRCCDSCAVSAMSESGRPDLNRGPPPPKGGALPGCATPRGASVSRASARARVARLMADVQPFRTMRYDPAVAGALDELIAPPYDVIDDELRAELAAKSPFNVVELDLPRGYEAAAATLAEWRDKGALVQEDEPAMWVLRQEYTAPDGSTRTRTGSFARVRVEGYGPGRDRPPERATEAEPFAGATDHEGTRNALWRVADPDGMAALQGALADAELLIADGHHRYETARVYADEVGGEGDHRYVLMLLVALEDPGLLVFPTHRLLAGLKDDTAKQLAI